MSIRDIRLESTPNLKDPVWFREWFKVIVRSWATKLTFQQLGLVIFIFDRTAAWGKEWELIRYSSFVNGITSADGERRYAAGMCNSERTARRLMKELLDMGAVLRKRSKGGYIWSLNYEWKVENMKATDESGQKWPVKSGQKWPVKSGQKWQGIKNTIEDENATQKNNPSDAPRRKGFAGDGDTSILTALEKARAKNKEAKERNELKRQGRGFNSFTIGKLWVEAAAKAEWLSLPGAPSIGHLSKREAQALKSYSDRFTKARPHEKFAAFVEWLFDTWPALRVECFDWMTKSPCPLTPLPLFVIRWADKLEDQFMQRTALARRMELSPEDKAINRLVHGGMSVDAARRKVLGKPMVPLAESKRERTLSRSVMPRKRKESPIGLPRLKESSFEAYEDQD